MYKVCHWKVVLKRVVKFPTKHYDFKHRFLHIFIMDNATIHLTNESIFVNCLSLFLAFSSFCYLHRSTTTDVALMKTWNIKKKKKKKETENTSVHISLPFFENHVPMSIKCSHMARELPVLMRTCLHNKNYFELELLPSTCKALMNTKNYKSVAKDYLSEYDLWYSL